MNRKVCIICAIVSGLWLLMSAGIAWHLLPPETYLVPIALLMGGSVVGISGQMEKRFKWVAEHVLLTKALVLVIGMPLAYVAVSNISPKVVGIELLFMLGVAAVLFPREAHTPQSPEAAAGVQALEEKLKNNCC